MSIIQEALQKAGRLPQAAATPAAKPAAVLPHPLTDQKPENDFLSRTKTLPPAMGIAKKTAVILAVNLAIVALSVIIVSVFGLVKKPVPGAPALASALVINEAGEGIVVPEYRLTGITLGEEKMALINNDIFRVGDFLPGEARIQSIQDSSVTLDFHGREIQLTL